MTDWGEHIRRDGDEAVDVSAIQPFKNERTVERTIARELRILITDGRLEPGLRLRYRDVAKQFGVSVTPVRIALHDLAKEGLVELVPHGGAFVSAPSRDELEELYATRAGVEGLIAHLGVENIDDEDVEEMTVAVAGLERFAFPEKRREYLDAVWAYKLPVYERAERPALFENVVRLSERAGRYSNLALGDPYRFEESLAFQQRFLAACVERDGWEAERVIRDAMDWTRSYLSKGLVDLNLIDGGRS